MTRVLTVGLIATLGMAILAPTLAAKGPTVKLTLSGPALKAPVEITTPGAIAASVYGGEFIGQPAAEPPKILPRYTVAFHVSLPREQGVHVMYVVRYVRDPFTGQGFVYLPAGNDEGARLNRTTIGRDGQDGHWHQATRTWSDAIAAALPR